MNYITLTIDKSALQALSRDEAKWLFHHFRINLPPVFFAEVLADLTKRRPSTSTSERDVSALAEKIEDHSVFTNEEALELITGELRGAPVAMTGQIIDARAQTMTAEDGTTGLFIDQVPTQEIIKRWKKGDFSQNEHDFARVWRESIPQIKLEETFRNVRSLRRPNVKTPADVLKVVDDALIGRDFELLRKIYSLFKMPNGFESHAIVAWRRANRPRLSDFVPYAFFNLRIETFFLVGLAHQVVGTRNTNRIDFEYLKYLPFTQVFSSSDDLHIKTAPLFLQPYNTIIGGPDLKSSMAEIAAHWAAIGDETRRLGSATYADFPPVQLDNAVTRIYDGYIPRWREGANQPRPPISEEKNRQIMESLKPMIEAMDRQRRRAQSNPSDG